MPNEQLPKYKKPMSANKDYAKFAKDSQSHSQKDSATHANIGNQNIGSTPLPNNPVSAPPPRNEEVYKFNRLLKRFGIFCIIALVLTVGFTQLNASSSLSENQAKEVLSNRILTQEDLSRLKGSNDASAGSGVGLIISSTDEPLMPQDYEITHSQKTQESSIKIWDYAAVDGDYVQVLVNGTPVTHEFMISHEPIEINVPSVGVIQVKGIRDGGGGITYAVYYEINGSSYFNSAPEGEMNTYTLNLTQP